MARSVEDLESQRAALLHELAQTGDMRRGSITEVYRRCGKPNCCCADAGHPGHGPFYAYTTKVAGKTRTLQLRPGARLSKLEREVAEYKHFRATSERVIEVNEQLCKARPDAAAQEKKNAIAEAFQGQIAAEVEALIGPQALVHLDFEAIETAARREALKVAAYAVAQRLNADHTDHGGPSLACACGELARYAGRHDKTIQTALGTMRLERAYYHCASCHRGYFPRDAALGIIGTSLSPALTRMIGLVGAMVSFEEGAELLGELAGIGVNAKQVERTAEALGAEIAADERQRVVPSAEPELAPTLYLGMDGTGIPMRATELAARQGKQPDGSAKTREVKLCTVWSAEGRDAEGTPIRDAGSITYSAAIESAASRDTDTAPSDFAQRVLREACRRGFEHATRHVVLGDGAPWIWNLADEYFPHALQIVDRFHAKQHLSDVAKAIYGAGSDLATQWARQRHTELDAGDIDQIISCLNLQANNCEAARKCIDYLQTNRSRMRYHEFRAQGLCTSTGVVEAGCKVAIGTRLKRAGMHWTLAGANAIIALRCCKLSRRFADFWEVRAERQLSA